MGEHKLHLTYCGAQLTQSVPAGLATLWRKTREMPGVRESTERRDGQTGPTLTGAVNMTLLLPGCNVTSRTLSMWPPSFKVTAGGLTQLGVSGGELLS